jgi:hypothetical protein
MGRPGVRSTPETAGRGGPPRRFSITARRFRRSVAPAGAAGAGPRYSAHSRIAMRLFCLGRSAAPLCRRRPGSRSIPIGARIRYAPIGWPAGLRLREDLISAVRAAARRLPIRTIRSKTSVIAVHRYDRGIRSNPRPIKGADDIMEILELARGKRNRLLRPRAKEDQTQPTSIVVAQRPRPIRLGRRRPRGEALERAEGANEALPRVELHCRTVRAKWGAMPW